MENDLIHATIKAYNAAVAAGDMDAILATFEPDAALVGEPGMVANGKDALRGAFEEFIGMKPEITMTAHEVIQAGDIATHSSTWSMRMTLPDGNVIEDTGFSVVVLRKQADGRWLMVIDNPFATALQQQG